MREKNITNMNELYKISVHILEIWRFALIFVQKQCISGKADEGYTGGRMPNQANCHLRYRE
jgi:hypothetical protein